jgi:hypothetical protein
MYHYRGGRTGASAMAAKTHNFFCQPNNRYNRAKHAIKDVHQVAMEKKKWNKTWVAMVMMDG